jgi:Ca2+-binding RTX toxin-like protein
MPSSWCVFRRWHGLLVMVSAVVTVLLVVPSVASARVARCMGHRATIVAKRGRIQIRGTSGRDVIVANAQANYINGRGGDDIICARGGADRARGGAGNDVVSAGRGSDELWGDLGDDILLGRHGSDIANGDLGDDIIKLGRGRDLLDYETAKPATIDLSTGVANGLGSDVVRGAESVVSAWNATEIDGNAAANRIDVYDAAEGIIVRGYGGNDTISCYGFACVNSEFFGDAGWDVLEGGVFSDTLRGGPGNDYLQGYEGDDTLLGGAGTDTAWGSNGTDTCVAEIRRECEH